MKGSEFIFDSVDLLYHNLKELSLNRKGSSYIDSPKWLKNKKATINPKNNDNNCFQYALTVALNYQNIKKVLQKISKFKPFIDQYNWKEIDFPSHSKDWKKFEQNNKTIALNILFVPHNTEKIRLAYKSKHNFKRENQVILLMITDGKKWHCLAVKSLSALLRGITSNHNGDFYCVKCFHSYSTKNKLKRYERGCTDHDYCHVDMPNEGNKVLKYKKGANSLKAPIMIYVHLECLLEKMRSCQNNLKNLTQRKKLSIRLLVTHYLQVVHLIKQKNNLTVTEAKTVWKGFCKRLRDHVMKIINYEEKEMILLTDKETES